MATDLKALVKRRATVKGQVSRLNSYVRQTDDLDIPALERRQRILEEYIEKYTAVQEEIEQADDSGQQEQERIEFETLCFECGDFIDRALYNLKHPAVITAETTIQDTTLSTTSSQSIIPKIQIQPFDGNYAQWQSFFDTFRSLVHESTTIKTVHKFHLLKSYLTGSAAAVTDVLAATDENYLVAWELVQKRFNKPRKIIQSHIRALFELPQIIKDSPSSLQALAEGAEMHVKSLRSLQQPVDWEEMLIYIVSAKLDKVTRTAWERTIEDGDQPKFAELLAFMNKYSRDDEPVQLVSQSRDPQPKGQADKRTKSSHRSSAFVSTSTTVSCALCHQNHYLNQCNQLLSLCPRERLKSVKALNRCINCLRDNHKTAQCRAGTCRQCKGKHHTLLHFPDTVSAVKVIPNTEPPKNSAPSLSCISVGNSEILLSTARVKILDRLGRPHECRVLLDPGSQRNFITEGMANKLQLQRIEINLPILGVGQIRNCSHYYAQSRIISRVTSFSCEAEFLMLPTITSRLPAQTVNSNLLNIPSNVALADPEFNKSANIDALFGEYLYYKLLGAGQIRLSNETTILQETLLGWIVSGRVGINLNSNGGTKCFLATTQLDSILTKFWELEECPGKRVFSREEEECEKLFQDTTRRTSTGRYVVRLPFNDKAKRLGSSYGTALTRLYSLERKLQNNSDLYSQYSSFLEEYEKLGHMTDITDSDRVHEGCYLPHHAVIKTGSLTSRLRVVFDGSAKTNSGISLNDCLMVGPTIQEDIFSLITRFRSHTYVLTADVEKMFRQITVDPKDAIYHKILWRRDPSEAIRSYRLDTVTYGTAAAPFLAVRCLHQLASDEVNAFPVAAEAIKTDFYMDDLLTGTSTLEDALMLRIQLIDALRAGGFNLRQWASNEPTLIEHLMEHRSEEYLYLDSDSIKKTLGIAWRSREDIICYEVKVDNSEVRATKRNILSRIAKLFDPLGLLGPVIIKAKLIMQQLWKSSIGWDEVIPSNLASAWKTYQEQLPLLNNFSLFRNLLIRKPVDIQIHGFCDASEVAYGACIYMRSVDDQNKVVIRLVAAKSRVAPLKTISLPRLELCAADLLSNLYQAVSNAMKLSINSVHFWSDSTIVLHWIRAPPHTLKTFVANRVSKIQKRTNCWDWNHVTSANNPADCISRGQLPEDFLQNRLWIEGPVWLTQAPAAWPMIPIVNIDIPERRAVITLVGCNDIFTFFERYSSISYLERVVAYCIRFYKNALQLERNTGPLATTEIQRANKIIIRCIQNKHFTQEVQDLGEQGFVRKESRIFSLTPFIDRDKIIRVGGRLKNSNIPYSQKYPILLPRSEHVTRLIIQYEHNRHMHAGVLGTFYAVRQRYWPIDGKNMTRAVVRRCIRCFRTNPRDAPDYLMGNLPKDRITSIRPFQVVGVDYCGPFFIKEKKYRNTRKLKVYVAVFVCFATKAIHLEIVSDLSTEAFLASLKRFFARRGYAHTIYSDNATNFVGAKNVLEELQSLVSSTRHNELVTGELSAKGISWHFSPPRSPHFGGLWEAAVKSFKHHLNRTVGDTLFTYEELNTYVIEIEAILNSRPLTPLSTDPNDLTALTPAHYLIGETFTSLPESDLTSVAVNRLSVWQHIQRVKQHFWSRWCKEYLNELNLRSKWRNNPKAYLKVGTLVLLKEENLPPMRWCLGRILEVYPGNDNIIRVVTVKTIHGTYKRSVKNICPLPIDQSSEQPGVV
ncbi:uncharacterized protein LOC143378082 [Andrena cerasifolii]|uniref:uncharacterized protein LOC143378082 n=1 Tax=Andrena cerasifolii TaxID=2819439 RepID=UPI0040377071